MTARPCALVNLVGDFLTHPLAYFSAPPRLPLLPTTRSPQVEVDFQDYMDTMKQKGGGGCVFKIHTYSGPTYCAACHKLLTGIRHQGFQCERCGMDAHKQCRKDVPACPIGGGGGGAGGAESNEAVSKGKITLKSTSKAIGGLLKGFSRRGSSPLSSSLPKSDGKATKATKKVAKREANIEKGCRFVWDDISGNREEDWGYDAEAERTAYAIALRKKRGRRPSVAGLMGVLHIGGKPKKDADPAAAATAAAAAAAAAAEAERGVASANVQTRGRRSSADALEDLGRVQRGEITMGEFLAAGKPDGFGGPQDEAEGAEGASRGGRLRTLLSSGHLLEEDDQGARGVVEGAAPEGSVTAAGAEEAARAAAIAAEARRQLTGAGV